MNNNSAFLDLDKILIKLPQETISNIRMYSHSSLKPEIKNEINKNKKKIKNTKNNLCVCHLEKWCEDCYGDFDLFD